MKKLLMVLALLPLMALADTETVDGVTWTYTISGGTAEVGTGYSSAISSTTAGAISIPLVLGGKPVTSIGSYAFEFCSGLKSMTIPKSVTDLGYSVFYGCTGLGRGIVVVDGCLLAVNEDCPADVVIGNAQIEKLPDELFEYCSNLKRVVLPTSLRIIGGWAFCGCHSMEGIQLPEGLVEIQEGAFSGCAAIQSFNIPASVTELRSLPTGWYDDWNEEVLIPSKFTKWNEDVDNV